MSATGDFVSADAVPTCPKHGTRLILSNDYVGDEGIWTCNECSAEFFAELEKLDKLPPEASFRTVGDMLDYLNDDPK